MPTTGRSCGPRVGTLQPGNRSYRDVLRDDPLIARNIFVGNQAWEAGGGIRFCFFGGALPEPTVTDNLIVDNRSESRGGGLVVIDAEVTVTNTTIVGNHSNAGSGGGVFVQEDGTLVLRNSIVAGNTGSGICLLPWGDLITDHCDVFGNSNGDYENCAPSPTDISCDPEFCAPEAGDYRLLEASCCQGAGAGGYDIGARGVGCFTVPDVLFYENFSDQHDDDWHVTGEGDASLEVVDGVYWGSLVNGAVTSVVASDFDTGNYACQLRIKPETELPDGTAGLDFFLRHADPEQFYRVHLGGVEGELWKRIGSHEQVLLTFPCQLVVDSWQVLSFTLVDWQLSGYLDTGDGPQELFVCADDNLSILTGTFGVGLSGSALNEQVVKFDEVLVAALDSTLTAVPADGSAERQSRPAEMALHVYPNPANPKTVISFQLVEPGPVRVTIHAIDGSLVATLFDGTGVAGYQQSIWRGCDDVGRSVASGTYVCRVTADGRSITRKLVLAR